MGSTFLLIAPEPFASEVAQLLRGDLDARVTIVAGSRAGIIALRRAEFNLIILEENLAAAEPEGTDALFLAADTAPILEVNFGLSGAERILRQVRSTLQRRAGDEAKAQKAVSHTLQNDLNASLAGLLLEGQLALRHAGPEILPKLQHLIDLASDLRAELRH